MTVLFEKKIWCGTEYRDLQDVQRKMVCDNGHTTYYDEQGRLHRDDGPAIENALGMPWRQWWVHGKKHRDPIDGPALDFESAKLFCWNDTILFKDGQLMTQEEAILHVHGEVVLTDWKAKLSAS